MLSNIMRSPILRSHPLIIHLTHLLLGRATRGGCELCGRVMPLTRHHLRPRSTHRKFLKQVGQ